MWRFPVQSSCSSSSPSGYCASSGDAKGNWKKILMPPVIKIHHSCDLPGIASQGRTCRNQNPWVIPRRTHFSICYCPGNRLPPNMLHSRTQVRHSSALHQFTEAGFKRKVPRCSVLDKSMISCKPFHLRFSLVDCVSQFPSGVGQADRSVGTHTYNTIPCGLVDKDLAIRMYLHY